MASAQPGKEDKGKVLKKDLPHIPCGVCMEVVASAYESVADKRSGAPYQKIDEGQVYEVLDDVCKPKSKMGEWMRGLDIVEGEDRVLRLERPGGVGKCESECKTIAKSCETVLDEIVDNLSGALWKNKASKDDMQKTACQEWSDVCSSKGSDKPIKASRNRKDFKFKPIEQKDLDMEQLMESMAGMGMGGASMHSRDDLMDMYGDMDGYGGGMDGMDPYGGMDGMDSYGGMDTEELMAGMGAGGDDFEL